MSIDLILWGAAIALLAAHWFVSASRLNVLGLALPVGWVVAVLAMAATGHMNGLRDWIFAVLGLLVLLTIWDRRRHEAGYGSQDRPADAPVLRKEDA